MLLADKTAVISGAASARGIGRATAQALRRTRRPGRHPRSRCRRRRAGAPQSSGEGHIGIGCDVADLASCRQAAEQAIGAFGKVDILINNAGISQPVKTMEITPEDWQRVVDVNMTGVLYLSQAFIPHMRARKQGSIACMSSVSAQRGGGIFGGPHYSAAKAGVLGLAKAMARELGPDGIRVNSVTPGLIQTDITGGKLTPEMRTEILKGIPLNRLGDAQDVAQDLPVPRLRSVRLRHRRGDRRQRRHADPLSSAAGQAASIPQPKERRRAMEARTTTLANAPSLEERAYRIRRNALRMGEVQGQGYIAQALGVADVLAVSYFHALRYQPEDPAWEGRDRFLLSIGHYAIALYAVLIEAGVIPDRRAGDLRHGRQPPADVGHGQLHAGHGDQRRLARHRARHRRRHGARPEAQAVRPLRLQPDVGRRAGRGADMGGRDVGRALEARQPDLPGGREPDAGRRSARPACSTSSRWPPKWEAFGWFVQRVDGNDIPALVRAFDAARGLGEPKPRVIICDTKMAKGVPFLEAREKSHFLRVEQQEWAQAIEALDAGRKS